MNASLPTMIISFAQVFKYHLCPVLRAVLADNCVLVEQIIYIDSISYIHMKHALFQATSLCQLVMIKEKILY